MLSKTQTEPRTSNLYIDGQWREPSSGKTFPVYNPATGEVFGHAPDGTREDAVAAYAAASRAQKGWAALPFTVRAGYLLKVADIFEKRAAEFIAADIAETGSWVKKARFEIGYLPGLYRAAAAAAYQATGETMPSDHGKVSMVERVPLGVISVISPWNMPILLSSRGLGVALAIGNTVVLKPSEESPFLGGLMLAEVFEEAGVPAGVLNVITCSRDNVAGIGDEMVENPAAKAISFTGSTVVGTAIAQKAGGLLKKACVELGSKDSMLVLDDADLDAAVSAARFGAFFHQGQICMATEKVIVDKSVAAEFLSRLIASTKQLRIGDPTMEENEIGPVINAAQADKVAERLQAAIDAGAKVEVGGGRNGLFFEPTVLTNVTEDMQMFHEETFGPVLSVVVADDEAHAIRLANNSKYGLSASIMTSNEERGLRVARQLETGMAHINDTTIYDEPTIPFGGTKSSGMGRHGGRWSIETFSETRWLTLERGGRKRAF